MRYLPLSPEDRAEMLATIGAGSVEDFFTDVPEAARLSGTIEGLPNHQGELAVERHMTKLAAKNRSASSGATPRAASTRASGSGRPAACAIASARRSTSRRRRGRGSGRSHGDPAGERTAV